jgi:hypothetical protein
MATKYKSSVRNYLSCSQQEGWVLLGWASSTLCSWEPCLVEGAGRWAPWSSEAMSALCIGVGPQGCWLDGRGPGRHT